MASIYTSGPKNIIQQSGEVDFILLITTPSQPIQFLNDGIKRFMFHVSLCEKLVGK